MRMTTDTVLITHVAGQAWLQTPNDEQVALRAGMRIPADARIVTGADAKVMLQAEGAAPMVVGQDADVVIAAEVAETRARAPESEPALMEAGESVADQVLALLDAGEDPFAVLDPTAAVLTGGGGGGTDVTRLSSVTETTASLSLDFPAPGVAALEAVPLTGGGAGVIGGDPLVPGPGQPDLPDQPGLPGPTIEIADMNDDGPDHVLPGTLSIEENNTEEGVPGWLTVTAPAGLSHLVFDVTGADGAPASQLVSLDALLGASADAPVVIDTDRGQLLITGYDRDSGRVDYTYRSDGPQDHGPATDGESVFDRIGITVVDDEGRTASSDLVANILDTVPRPVDDHDTITDGEQATVSGNILDNDAHSGDPVTITGARADGGDEPVGDDLSPMPPGGELVLFGSYGDLTIHADGTYTYTLAVEGDPRYAALQALGEGDEAKENFAYRVTDSDGDSALGSITITVVGANNAPTLRFDGQGGHAAVSEEGLSSNYVNNEPTDNGNLHGAGVADENGRGDGADTTDSATSSGTFSVSDADHAAGRLTVSLGTEGLPTDWTSSGQTIQWSVDETGHVLRGTVEHGSGAQAVVDTVLQATLTDNGDGSYRYDVVLRAPIGHPDQAGEDVLGMKVPITVTDPSGAANASSTYYLDVQVEDDSPLAADIEIGVTEGDTRPVQGNIMDDARFDIIAGGSGDPDNQAQHGSWGGDGPMAGDQSYYKMEWAGGDAHSGDGESLSDYGTLTLHPDGNYRFDLNNDSAHTQALRAGETKSFSIGYTIYDSDGDKASAELVITITGTGGDADPHADRAAPAPGDAAHDTVLAAAFAAGTDAAPRVDDHPPHPVGPISLAGSPGDDVFVWTFADRGAGQAPAADHIADFGMGGSDPNGRDRIDLSELLSDRAEGEDLTHYLQISGDGHQTVINVSTTGHVDTGHDRQIIIDNVDLTAGGPTDQHELIGNLIHDGKLKVDAG
ncbi:retention module-containing protein [Castellaniella denitrificans]|uniref:retention module-containing protein n=1 Tax=Castellaniella denitrificans TaxID=56119 RepID=UPI00360E3DA4